MKKIFFTLLFLHLFANLEAQTKLASHSLELSKPKSTHAIRNAVNHANNEVFVIATDKQTVKVHKYNSALFLIDSLTMPRPESMYSTIAGHSLSDNGNPEIYWTSNDLKKIFAVSYGFSGSSTAVSQFAISFEGESVLNAFSGDDTFYILTHTKSDEQLKLYAFRNGKLEEKIIDFSKYEFAERNYSKKKMGMLLSKYPLQIVDTHALNPLFFGTAISKMFVEPDKIILTFDLDATQTYYFEIDLKTFIPTQKIFAHSELSGSSKANSYYHDDKLYQIKLHDKAMILSAKSTDDGELIKSYSVTESDTISFKNSPLYNQVGQRSPKIIKSTKQFLSRLSNGEVGISVYQTPDNVFLTVGGIRYVQTTARAIAGGVGIILAGGGDFSFIEDLEDDENLQSIYFEGLFNADFLHQDVPQSRLAADYISQFMYENEGEISISEVFRYRDYFILGYYYAKANKYVMRKFADESFSGNRF